MKATRLEPELRSLTEGSAEGLLADERDRLWPELSSDAPEAVSGAREVGPPKLARACRRPIRSVGEAETVVEENVLLARIQAARGQAGFVEQPPEIVARVGEVVPRGRRAPPRVDPAEDDT